MTPPQPAAFTRRQRALLELGALDPHDFDGSLRQILAIDADALSVARVSFWCLRRDPLRLECEAGWRSDGVIERGARVEQDSAPCYFRAINEEMVVAADDACADPRTRELSADYLRPLGIGALMDVPVWSHGGLAGVLCHEHFGSPRVWRADECEFATAVGQVVATALEARQRSAAEEGERRASLLAEASGLLNRRLGDEDLPERVPRLFVPAVADWCVLAVREELAGEDRWRLATAPVQPGRGRSSLESVQHGRVERALFSAGRTVLETGEPVLLPRVTPEQLEALGRDDEEVALLRALGTRSLLAVPLEAFGRRLGVLVLGSGRARRPFRSQDLRLAEQLAERAAMALENARLYSQAREAVAARDEFISVAGHELRNPLAALQLATRALAQQQRGAVSGPTLELVRRQVDQLGQLVEELLDLTRLRTGQLDLQRERVDLCELVREVSQTLGPSLEAAGCALRLECAPSVVGRWDRDRLARVLINLLGNAIKFGADAPIGLVVAAEPEGARLSVRDRGPGIDPELLPRVFELYASAPQRGQGLGLGLFIVRGIAEAHGGEVTAVNEPNGGATVRVSLPWDESLPSGGEPPEG